MKLKYKLNLREEIHVPDSLRDDEVRIDSVIISWKTKEGRLDSISLILENVPMCFNQNGAIEPSRKNIPFGRVKKVATYIANRILIQTNQDAVNIESSFNGSPEMIPESDLYFS